jgi:hypothetical protein
MIKAVLIVLSVVIAALGLGIYASGHRTRKSLDVPLLSKHGALFLGSCMALFGLALLAVALIYVR